MTNTLTLQIVLAVLGLAGTIFTLWLKRNDQITKEREDAKKEISDAIASGDISRINGIINKLRR